MRLALGADRARILQLIVGRMMRPVFLSLTLALIASMAIAKLLESLPYDVSPRDPMRLIAISLLLVSVALAATPRSRFASVANRSRLWP